MGLNRSPILAPPRSLSPLECMLCSFACVLLALRPDFQVSLRLLSHLSVSRPVSYASFSLSLTLSYIPDHSYCTFIVNTLQNRTAEGCQTHVLCVKRDGRYY